MKVADRNSSEWLIPAIWVLGVAVPVAVMLDRVTLKADENQERVCCAVRHGRQMRAR
jgi:hypothetical protein